MKKRQLKIKHVVGACIGLSTSFMACHAHAANMQLSLNKTKQPLAIASSDSSQCLRDFARVSQALARCKNRSLQYENCRLNLLKTKRMLLDQNSAQQNTGDVDDDDDSDDEVKYIDDEGNRIIPMF